MNEDLLIRYLTHRCTPVEIKDVNKWVATDQANADWLFEMERIWSLKNELRFSHKREIEDAYKLFLFSLQKNSSYKKDYPPKRSLSFSWLKYAVAIFLIGLLSMNLYLMFDEEEVRMNEIEVPNGQRVSLVLSDGTRVWLNSRSKFTYPSVFAAKSRNVKLEGEGFFEVAHNKKIPFIVQSDLVFVRVLGTKFNMKAYLDEPSSVTLSEGKVEVVTNDNTHQMILKPNEQATYTKEAGFVKAQVLNAEVARSWTLGEAAYINKRLDEITSDLERKFNVRIHIKDKSLASEIFTCRFKEGATIEQVLTLLKETRDLDYIIKGDQIQIYKPIK